MLLEARPVQYYCKSTPRRPYHPGYLQLCRNELEVKRKQVKRKKLPEPVRSPRADGARPWQNRPPPPAGPYYVKSKPKPGRAPPPAPAPGLLPGKAPPPAPAAKSDPKAARRASAPAQLHNNVYVPKEPASRKAEKPAPAPAPPRKKSMFGGISFRRPSTKAAT